MSLAKWELVQKRAFTHWVNSQLGKRDIKIESLEEGLQSGVHLIDLIEILTGKQVLPLHIPHLLLYPLPQSIESQSFAIETPLPITFLL